jgi:two-component system cell cycle sensor histidine kinase/response regulator CckA
MIFCSIWRKAGWLLTGLLLAGVLMFAANLEANRQERQQLDDFRGDTADLARVSETIIADRLRDYDNSLLVLRDSYTVEPRRFVDNIRLLRSGPLADRDVLVVLTNREGYVTYTDAPNVKPGLDVGSSAYFRYFADGGKDGLHIAAPLFGRVTKRYTIPLARPVYDKQGGFSGVVALSVKQDSIANFGPRLQLSRGTEVTVVYNDGAIVSRSSDFAKVQGTRLAPELLAPLLKGENGVFSSRAPFEDGAEKVIAYRHIQGTPLILYVESSPENVLRQTSKQRSVLMGTAIFTSLVILTLIAVHLKGRKISLQLIDSMRRSKEREYKTLTGTSLDGFWIFDDSTRILDVNETLCKMLGYTREELLSLNVSDIDVNNSPEQIADHIRKFEEIGSDRFQSRHRRKDGAIIDVEISAQSVREPTELFFVFVRDITEIKRSEEILRKSEERFRVLVNNLPVKVFTKNRESVYLDCNPKYAQDLGINPEEISGRNDFDFYPRELAEKYRADDMMIMNSGLGKELEEAYIKDGDQFWVQTIKIPLMDGAHNVTGLLGVFWDITDRKKAAEEKQLIEQQFQQTQKLESLGVLAGGIAHDFNNILTSIVGNADLALMRMNPESPAIDNLHKIEQAAARAADLAKQMLAYSGKGKFVVENLDMNRLLKEMLHMLEVSISKKAVLRFDLAQNLPSVEADATQMRQIVMNLVINASEAIGDKSGVISITTGCVDCSRDYLKNVWLEENIKDGLYVYLEVADTGCGMDNNTRTKLFDPFFTTKFTGRGLGMAAVLGIVKGHKGAINVYSEPGKGTTFKILLPASNKPAEIFNYDSHTDDWKGEGKVLLVDDEETIRGIGKEMLQEFGFTTITANDGRDAVEIFKQNPDIAFVILDLTMPHMDGEECFLELKKLKPEAKIIISSGFSEHEISQKFAGKGLAGFIQKPYKLSVLKEAIQKI